MMELPEVRRLMHSRGDLNDVSTDTQIVQDTDIKSLKKSLWRKYISTRTGDPPETALKKFRFLKEDTNKDVRATVAGILLTSEDPRLWLPNAWIQAVSYRGTKRDGNHQITALDISGPLDEQVRSAMHFVSSHMRVAAYKNPGRVEIPQFSLRAVFEAVVNAVVHRDYSSLGSRIRLFMYEDRLELFSPGGLSNSMTIDDLGISQYTRNELIASRLGQCRVGDDIPGSGGRLYFLERRGEGIPIIESHTYALTGQRPSFQLISGRELVVILPSARLPVPEGVPVLVEVYDNNTGKPLPDVNILILNPNNTYSEAKTDSTGKVNFVIHERLPITIFCATEGFSAHVERYFLPDRPLKISLESVQDGGSEIITDRSGVIPSTGMRVDFILDSLDRSYLYAFESSINNGLSQPVTFLLNETIFLKDRSGTNVMLWVREIIGTSCVFDYEVEKQ